ncbi:MAG: 4-alpha-glucanotransferase [Dysgonomonas sp.]
MRVRLQLNYSTNWGQTLHVYGPGISSDDWNENLVLDMSYVSASEWAIELDIKDRNILEYRYLVKENGRTINKEWGEPHFLNIQEGMTFLIDDVWQTIPQQSFLYTSGFSNSFFFHKNENEIKYYRNTILIAAYCQYVKEGQTLILCGSSHVLGEWQTKNALRLQPVKYGLWQVAVDASLINEAQDYKLAIYDNELQEIVYWEEGANRIMDPLALEDIDGVVKIESVNFRRSEMDWKAAGLAIPIFSLRSEDSFGIGEFSDLKKMVDWTAMTGQKIIQVLPINDTTVNYTWADSYPYNAISIYALHPIYLGLKDYRLENSVLYEKYKDEARVLNRLPVVDYEKVLALKLSYIKDLFNESGHNILNSKEYKDFYGENQEWLFPYACFCHFRDKNKTADYLLWESHSIFSRNELKNYVDESGIAKTDIDLTYFTQYLLHKQLVDVKEYAHQNQVILKGDIPIGINRCSVEAWVDPHLFNLDVQAGAPPDDFSIFGQNWRFPTYNWEEMAKDGYEWWIRRFRKMTDYFDAYRIDHILGFFRIWEIPMSSVQGLLGYFSPALPLTLEDIHSYGVWLDIDRMLKPYIHEDYLDSLFGIYSQKVIEAYFIPVEAQRYALKEEYDTQLKIKEHFGLRNDNESQNIQEGLYYLCNNVLFIKDKKEPDKYHPRITAQHTHSFKDLDDATKNAFNQLYDDFFFRRHSQYWREQAMRKLPTLISSTSMLVCGEDLGMVPESVPSVMKELQILSLEVERMPKDWGMEFNLLSGLPYLSVCTTSTHDMSPLRLWWKENNEITQRYYNNVLNREGIAPEECTSDICLQIVNNHLHSPAILTILPLQDWLSIDDNLKNPNLEDERINIPAIPDHYWRYRMHLTLEELIKATEFNQSIKMLVESSGRK